MNTHLTPRDLAARWGSSVGTLANQRSAGEGPTYLKLGARVIYRLCDVQEYEAARLVTPARTAARLGEAA